MTPSAGLRANVKYGILSGHNNVALVRQKDVTSTKRICISVVDGDNAQQRSGDAANTEFLRHYSRIAFSNSKLCL